MCSRFREAWLFLLFLSSCDEATTFTTPLIPALPAASLTAACQGGGGASDTFELALFAFEGEMSVTPGLLRTACARCTDPDAPCRLLERSCRCASPRREADEILEAMSGMGFDDLDPDLSLCVRALLYSQGGIDAPVSGPGQACECPEPASTPIRMCALSDAGSVNESQTPIVVREFHCTFRGPLDCAALKSDCEERGQQCDEYESECLPRREPSVDNVRVFDCASF